MVLDKGAESLQQRVANKLYESSRAGSVEVANFPEYKHLLSALQHVQPSETQTSYQVTVKRHDKLLVLSALASKFLESDDFKDEVTQLIEKHNESFNPDGDYMAEPETTRTDVEKQNHGSYLFPVVWSLATSPCRFVASNPGRRMMTAAVLWKGLSWKSQKFARKLMWESWTNRTLPITIIYIYIIYHIFENHHAVNIYHIIINIVVIIYIISIIY